MGEFAGLKIVGLKSEVLYRQFPIKKKYNKIKNNNNKLNNKIKK